MSAHFKAVDRQSLYMFPPSVEDWLDQKHLARFIVDVVSKLDLHELKMPYSGGGSQAYHPEMLLALLFYGYATGVFSSRKLEQATYDSIAFRYIAANTHPDHDTLAVFRKRFLQQLKPLFVQILLLAKTLGFLNLGKISLDGSKVQANASKHSALSWGHAIELEQQLNQEVARLMAMAEEADSTEVPDGMDIPSELAQREQRLKAIAEAKAKLEARAAERQAAEQAEYEAKQAQRQAKAQSSGRPPRGPEPKPPEPGVRNSDQINLTDEQSRIMPASGKSFQQAYNVQAGVETESLLIVTEHVTQAVNDKREVTPTLEALDQLPEALGKAEALLADNGYYSEANVKACQAENLTPYIAAGREGHHLSLEQRWADPPLAAEADAVEAMKHRLQTRQGRAIYGRRKCTVEPVFGIIKAVLGFRQFHLRGLEAVTGEWTLVTLAWNLKRMFSLQQQTLRTQTA
jgi:transposase/IS5 family transposase